MTPTTSPHYEQLSRRTYLKAAGLFGLATTMPLAGCTTRADPPINPPDVTAYPDPIDYGTWFDDVSNYQDTTWDYRGKERVTIDVGAPGSDGYYKFGPAAVAVSPGTVVVWKWTGMGGGHDVVASNGSFKSAYLTGAGKTFSHTFDASGLYTYYCSPHKSMGMKGAVYVVNDIDRKSSYGA